ncbi:MAG: VCBS repeat-containing protein [Acidobacteriia bacterium]|nr:VCBS repeat-containing protein [Terriglobia bacterium]
MSTTNHNFVSLVQDRARGSARSTWSAWVLMFLAVTIPAVLAHAATPPPAKFTTGQLFSIGEDFRQDLTVFWLANGDFNGDGKLDLVSADAAGPAFSVMLGNGDGTFQPGNVIFLPTGSPAAEYIAVGDVNQDGRQDVLIRTASGPSLVLVYLGDGRGGFSLAGTYVTGNSGYGNLHGMTLADLRGIGKLDIVATNRDDNTISVLLGNGDGTFQSQVSFSVGPANTAPLDVAVGDFNKDGHLDAVTVDASNGISVLLGNGNGSFQAPTFYTGGYSVSGVAVADLNRDGNLDIVISSWLGATVFLGTGGGAFAPGVSYGVPFGNSIAIGDLNGDKKLDLVIADQYDSAVYALLGKGDGTFQPPVGYMTDWNSQSLVLADFNDDSKLDFAVGNTGGALGTIALGNGDGTFRASTSYSFTADANITIASADLNGDGNQDVVMAGNAPNTLSVMMGNSHGVLGTPGPIVITDQGYGVSGLVVATGDSTATARLTSRCPLGEDLTTRWAPTSPSCLAWAPESSSQPCSIPWVTRQDLAT